jgi:hypothetical protein
MEVPREVRIKGRSRIKGRRGKCNLMLSEEISRMGPYTEATEAGHPGR